MKLSEKAKSLILILISIVIVVGMVVIVKAGLNTSMDYSSNEKVKISLGQNYDVKDINDIAKDVLGNGYKVQKVEIYNETVAITAKEISDEQLQSIKDQVKEKYSIDDIDSAVTKLEFPTVSMRDVVRNYIMPAYIILVSCMAYLMIRYYKVGVLTVMYDVLKNTILGQGLYFSILAITRIPVGVLLMPVSAILFVCGIIFTISELKNTPEKVKKAKNEDKE